MKWKNRLTNYNFWVSIVSAVLLILQSFNIQFDISNFNEITTAVLGLLVVIGIINDPTKSNTKPETSEKTEQIEQIENKLIEEIKQITVSSENNKEEDGQEKESVQPENTKQTVEEKTDFNIDCEEDKQMQAMPIENAKIETIENLNLQAENKQEKEQEKIEECEQEKTNKTVGIPIENETEDDFYTDETVNKVFVNNKNNFNNLVTDTQTLALQQNSEAELTKNLDAQVVFAEDESLESDANCNTKNCAQNCENTITHLTKTENLQTVNQTNQQEGEQANCFNIVN